MAVRGSSVILCCFALTIALTPSYTQPTFGALMCMLCDGDSDYDLLNFWLDCDDCPSTPSSADDDAGPSSAPGGGSKPSKAAPSQPSMNMSLQFPPSALGMNLTMVNSGGSWLMNLMPWIYGSATPATTASTAAPTTTPAPTTTAAPAGNSTAGTTTTKK
ncbi:hypothetical protein EVAR_96280_1 [Eumeta japonica]|uniref:Uncharacterized protein n=1 Tax=Eumeta variegata TaxID=151549 RepID=A0A4C1WJY2_EUMVA|nr:hypothetical protein EVAR_96280_1 [Eumeta japonica]